MEKKRGRAGAFFLSGLMCLTSLAGLSGSARAAGLEAKCLVPVGHTIGIKLFAEGVVVIGLSEVETASGVAAPGAACGEQRQDIKGRHGAELITEEHHTIGQSPFILVCHSEQLTR